MTSASRGFTIVEVLISLGILSIVLGLAVTSYRNFETSQALTQSSENLKTNLRFAQSQAFGGVKTGCNTGETLEGWYLQFTNNTYEMGTYCSSTGKHRQKPPTSAPPFTLPQGVTTTFNSCLLFRSINRGVGTCASPSTSISDTPIILVSGATSYTITVKSSGDISLVKN